MAKSEHQGLQIALILFVMVSVVLAITTFVFYRQSNERAQLETAAKKAAEDAKTRANDAESRLEYAMHILGAVPLPEAQADQLKQAFSADEKMKTVIANYEEHMSTYGAGLSKEEQNYKSILPKILTSMRQANLAVLASTADNAKYKEERDSTQKSESDRTSEALQKQAEADRRLEEERAKYEADRQKLADQQQKELEQFVANLKKKETEVALASQEREKTEKEMKKQQQVIETQAETIIKFRDEPFEVADGTVTWVNQSANIAWINLGSADGLRPQTLFSVYDQADNGVKRTSRKASIEVTRVLNEHLAEARIVDDSAANPILPGDQVFSPAWRPGKRIRFALAGFLDIDGDGRSDRNLVRSLLSSSGGAIDQEMLDDGSIVGEGMTSSTRYLVLGETPTDESDPKILAAWSKMNGEAKQYGVEIISLEKMLEWVGYRPEVRTVGLGKNADSSQFKMQPSEGRSPTTKNMDTDRFRERRPPTSAFSK